MKQIIAIAIVAVLVVMGGGFVFLSQRDAGQEAPAPADGAPQVATAEDAVPVAAREPVATREKEFEDILNNFLTQINDQVRDYRTERKILGELNQFFIR